MPQRILDKMFLSLIHIIINYSFTLFLYSGNVHFWRAVPKQDPDTSLNDLRCISPLSVLLKMTESVLLSLLTERFSFGFRKKFSTTLALTTVFDNIIYLIGRGRITVLFLLDMVSILIRLMILWCISDLIYMTVLNLHQSPQVLVHSSLLVDLFVGVFRKVVLLSLFFNTLTSEL